jgi:hypothetical protein
LLAGDEFSLDGHVDHDDELVVIVVALGKFEASCGDCFVLCANHEDFGLRLAKWKGTLSEPSKIMFLG